MFQILKGIICGFYDFVKFSVTINELNSYVERALKNYRSKSESTHYSKWIRPGVKNKETTQTEKGSDTGIYSPLKKMYALDTGFILVTVVLVFLCSSGWSLLQMYLEGYLRSKWIYLIQSLLNIFVQLIWRLVITVLIELINMVHLKQLTRKIHLMLDDSKGDAKKTKAYQLAKSNQSQIMSRLHTYAFFFVFPLQIIILDWILPFDVLKSISLLLHNSLLYSFYSFDHIWSRENVLFEQRIQRMIMYMPYFIGYGSCVGLIQMMWPGPISIGAMLTVYIFPLLVVNAYRVDWTRVHGLHVGKWLALLGKWFLRPSLAGCQLICFCVDKAFEYFSR